MFRNSDPFSRSDATAPFHSRGAAFPAGRNSSSGPARCAGPAHLGIRCHGAPMQPAALRVLETTWRVWREPLA
jgi:hypothetical protein